MNWTAADSRRSRPNTFKLLDMINEGGVDKDSLINDLLGFMSDSDVGDFMRRNDYIQDDSDNEESEDNDPEDAVDPHDIEYDR